MSRDRSACGVCRIGGALSRAHAGGETVRRHVARGGSNDRGGKKGPAAPCDQLATALGCQSCHCAPAVARRSDWRAAGGALLRRQSRTPLAYGGQNRNDPDGRDETKEL